MKGSWYSKNFLGMEVLYNKDGSLEVNQTGYALDILKKFDMLYCKPSNSLVQPGSKLLKEDIELIQDHTSYRALVGSLQYLSQTRSDLVYATNQVSQFLHEPRSSHLQAAKRILRYLKGALGNGLKFSKNGSKEIISFSDTDFNRKSTTGACILVAGNLVTWVSKKQSIVSRSSAEFEYRALHYYL